MVLVCLVYFRGRDRGESRDECHQWSCHLEALNFHNSLPYLSYILADIDQAQSIIQSQTRSSPFNTIVVPLLSYSYNCFIS